MDEAAKGGSCQSLVGGIREVGHVLVVVASLWFNACEARFHLLVYETLR